MEYFHPPTRKEDITREDGIAVELPDTVYDAPLQLSNITDEYANEMAGRTTTGGGVIPFMILFRTRGTKEWKIPPAQTFYDLINMIEVATIGDRHLNAVITWSNMWGGVGLVGLSSKNLPMLNIMRAYISDAAVKNWEFCSIPKEGIIFNKDLSVMLRGDMAGISPAGSRQCCSEETRASMEN